MPTKREQDRIMMVKVGEDGTGYIVDGLFFGTREAAQKHVREGSRFGPDVYSGHRPGRRDIVLRSVGDTFIVGDAMFEDRNEAMIYVRELARSLREIEKVPEGWRARGRTFSTREGAEKHVRMVLRDWLMMRRAALVEGRAARIQGAYVMRLPGEAAEPVESEKPVKKEKPAKPGKRDKYEAIKV